MNKRIAVLLAGALLSACLLDSNEGSSRGEAGYARVSVNLDRNATTFLKSAGGTDSTFDLDSLKIILTAPGAATKIFSYPIQGRPDTGAILAGTNVYGLEPLRTWKAKVFTLDTNVNPALNDTVHLDSVSFSVYAGDTTAVNLTVRSAYTVLRVRLVSTSSDSLPTGIQFARIRLNGVTRDSVWVEGGDAHNATFFPTLTTGWVVADGGHIWKSIDSGNSWYSQVSPTTENLNALWFDTVSGVLGWTVGNNGTILRTKNGTTWTSQTSGTTAKLNRVVFVDAAKGYVVGNGGVILKSIDSGSTWNRVSGGWFSQTSPTASGLNAVVFKGADSGWIASGSQVLSTTNSGNLWTSTSVGSGSLFDIDFAGNIGVVVGQDGQVLQKSGAGAWAAQNKVTSEHLRGLDLFDATTGWAVGEDETIVKTTDGGVNWVPQTTGWSAMRSGVTSSLRSLNMGSATTGWAVGTGGFVTKTTNGGVNWTSQTSTTAQDLNTVFVTDANRAHAVGNAGVLVKSNSNGTTWSTRATGTTQNLRDVDFATGLAGWAVGDSETVVRTLDTLSWRTMPGGWTVEPSGVTDTLLATSFIDGLNGWSVGNAGKILRTSDGGDSWTLFSANGRTRPLRSVSAANATTLVAVGDSGIVQRTTNSGTNWTTVVLAGAPVQRAVYFLSATLGWMAGESGSIRKTVDGGANWTVQTLSPANGSAVFRGIHATGTYTWIVGSGGLIYRQRVTAGTADTSVANGGGTPQFNSIYAMNTSVAVVVGDGGVIRRTANGTAAAASVTWTAITSGTSANLRHVWFKGTTGTADTGYIVGDGGLLLKSTNSGTSWTTVSSGTTKDLRAVHARPGAADSILYVGDAGLIARTINGGLNWARKSTRVNFTGVDFFDANTGYITAADGRILKTTNGGLRWSVDSSNSIQLNGVYFRDASIGWVVGNNGLIRKTTNGGTLWTTQAAGTFAGKNLLRVYFNSTFKDTGWIAGENGTLIRTTNGGTNWALDTTKGSTQALRGIFSRSRDTAFAVGDSGMILRTVNNGSTVSGLSPRTDFYGVSSPTSAVAYAVGVQGLILKTTNGGATWAKLNSGVSSPLLSAHFPVDANTGYVVGSSGKVLKTTDAGASWASQTLGGGTPAFTRVRFANASIGYITGTGGVIYRTVDAGANWVAQTSETTTQLQGIFPVNADTAFAVGLNGTILKTRDSGVVVTTANLNSTFFRGDIGYAAGDGGATFRTGDGGASWTPLTGATAKLNDVFISPSGNNIYAVGDGGFFASSSNAGVPTTWTNIRNSGTTRNLQGIWVSSTSPGPATIIAVGDSGTIRINRTGSIGDLTGTIAPLGVTTNLRAVQCRGGGNNCWAAGGNETVLRSTDGRDSIWVVKSTGPKLFDLNLVTKYLRPGVSNTLNLQAIDRTSPLRGFQANYTFTMSPGQDTTITSTLTRCGYGGPVCSP